MNPIRIVTLLLLPGLWFIASDGAAQLLPGQAVTYRNFDYVRAVTASNAYAYYASTGGVIRYDKLREQWDLPHAHRPAGAACVKIRSS